MSGKTSTLMCSVSLTTAQPFWLWAGTCKLYGDNKRLVGVQLSVKVFCIIGRVGLLWV